MENESRAGVVVGAVLLIGLGIGTGCALAGEAWSAGAIGFPLLLSLPGLWLLARAASWAANTTSLVALALAVALIGLDVGDSARTEVVIVGWVLAVASVLGLLALVAVSCDATGSDRQ